MAAAAGRHAVLAPAAARRRAALKLALVCICICICICIYICIYICKNEARFLPEWLAHQLTLGFDHVFLLDHESTDGTAALIARVARILDPRTHVCQLSAGTFVHPNGAPIDMPARTGRSLLVEHSVAQLNHYQVKSREEFDARMRRGRASPVSDGPDRFRTDPAAFLAALDRNDTRYDEITRHSEAADPLYREMLDAILE